MAYLRLEWMEIMWFFSFFFFSLFCFFPGKWAVFIWRIFLFFTSSFSWLSKVVSTGYLPEVKGLHNCEQQLWRRYCDPSGWSPVCLFHHIIFEYNLLLQWRLKHVNVFVLVSLVISTFLRQQQAASYSQIPRLK